MNETTNGVTANRRVGGTGWLGVLSVLAAAISSGWVYLVVQRTGWDLVLFASVPGVLIAGVGVVLISLTSVGRFESVSSPGWIGVMTILAGGVGSGWTYLLLDRRVNDVMLTASVPAFVIGLVGIVLISIAAVIE